MSGQPGTTPPGSGVWEEIRRRIAALEREERPVEDLAALWKRRALELAADVGREIERGAVLRAVVVRFGADRYGIRITSVREILKVGRVTAVPGVPQHVAGVINLRGTVLTVLDVRSLLGLEPVAVGAPARILVLEGAGMTVGLLAEEVEEILEVPAAQVKPPITAARGAADDLAAGIVAHRGQMVVLLDIERMLRAPRLAVDEVA